MTEKGKDSKNSSTITFPVIGMGASAGGLEAFEQFFRNMPSDSGMAFILVVHLDPTHKPLIAELLKKYTKMETYQVSDGMRVEPNNIYIIPPNSDMAIKDGILYLMDPVRHHELKLPIDFFFRSLAQDQRENAICVILSGTGSDGTLGLRAIKGEGGMVLVQDPSSAKYDGMPQSAIATGLVDFILPVEKIPEQLIGYLNSTVLATKKETLVLDSMANTLQKIFILIHNQTGHDFSSYKSTTINRRIERRMSLHQLDKISDYFKYLERTPQEVKNLSKDLLIGVTYFFRDPEAFKILEEKVIPQIFSNKSPSDPIRIWIPSCSTGEEAYSIAILIKEYMSEQKHNYKIQIFATDVDENAIYRAREGVFPDNIVVDVSKERLTRFFIKKDKQYQIKPEIREMVVFALQDILTNAPFSKVDLISCRNLLIYLNPDVQKRIIPLFHYALNQNGFLFLGSSETIGEFIDLFSFFDKKWKIYKRKIGVSTKYRMGRFPIIPLQDSNNEIHKIKTGISPKEFSLNELTEMKLLEKYASPCVIINEKGTVLFFYGRTGKYLEPAPGTPSLNILDMAREGLKYELASIIRRVTAEKREISTKGVHIKHNDDFLIVNIVVTPISEQNSLKGLMMVIFEDVSTPIPLEVIENESAFKEGIELRIKELERELNATKEYLQSTIEELETSNEELTSTNEELVSSNEELQSSNEELETSREELQSLNEELVTVNTELQHKIEELAETNNDMNNLLVSTEFATIFLDINLNIKRFTPKTINVISLIQTDIGRPVIDIVSKFDYPNMIEDIGAVISTLVPIEKEVRTKEGLWYLMRILPYRTLDNIIDGVVITFMNITERKQAEIMAYESQIYAESIVDTVREPLIILDTDLRVKSANRSFYKLFKVEPEETEKKLIYEIGNNQWDIPDLRILLEEIIPKNTHFHDFSVEHKFPVIGHRKMLLNARKIDSPGDKPQLILLAIEDITREN